MPTLADEVFGAVRGYIQRSFAPVLERIKALEDRPAPKDGAPGAKGDPGVDGKDGAPGERGEPGQDGKPGDAGKDGAPGERGEKGDAGERGEKGEPGLQGERGEPGPAGEKGADGINGKDGAPGADGQKGLDGEPGRDGLEGPPGRDALQVEVLASIDPLRKYQRGTWASHKGGLVRAYRATDPLGDDLAKCGWECVVNGVDSIELAAGADLRTLGLTIRTTNGNAVTKELKIPVTIHRGIWKEDEVYARGDATTRDGSTWILMADQQKGKPGDEGSGWQLSTKRGRDGKDGLRGEKGERGAEGRAGKDLTQMTADGRRY